jgi:Flp pilus assembly protein TadD
MNRRRSAAGCILAVALALGTACTPAETESQPRGVGGGATRGVPPRKLAPPSEPEIPEGAAFVGEEGTDADGYPRKRPDRTVMLALLRARRFAELDAAFEVYQGAFEADFRKEWWPLDAVQAFGVPDDGLQAHLDAWVAASPESYGAAAARGAWHVAKAWKARGGGRISETSEEQLEGMRKEHVLAALDYRRALDLRPRFVAAVHGLFPIARGDGAAADIADLLALGRASCDACYELHQTALISHAPRWGGSWADMDAIAAKTIARLGKDNPKLRWLAGWSAFDRCRTLREDGTLDAAGKACDEALTHGDDPRILGERAEIFNAQERFAEALDPLDRALAIAPQDRECLRARAIARGRAEGTTRDITGSAQDMLVARRLDPSDERQEQSVRWMLQKLRYDAGQAAQAGKPEEEKRLRALAEAIAPGSGAPQGPAAATDAQIAELQAAVAAAPDDFDVRLRLDAALVPHRRFDDIIAMWTTFLAAHPDHARAFQERGGARWHHGDKPGAIGDTQRACDLGEQPACRAVAQMRKRK